MTLEVKKLLYDLDQALELINHFTYGKQLADYQVDALPGQEIEGIKRDFGIE